jgi:hypothetical protein
MIKKILLAGMFALSTVACGGNECEDAADKVEECGVKLSTAQQAEADKSADECSGVSECAAKCINDASCEDIKNFNSDSPSLDNPILACAGKCGD